MDAAALAALRDLVEDHMAGLSFHLGENRVSCVYCATDRPIKRPFIHARDCAIVAGRRAIRDRKVSA